MLTNDDIVRDFDRNRRVIRLHTEGLTNAESLIQPLFAANCLNWTVGHVVVHRDKVLAALGRPPVLDQRTTARYDNESNPITGDGPDIRPLDELLDALDTTQERLADALADADLSEEMTIRERRTTVGKRIHYLYFHETYHTGQTELLRALAGRTDKVI